MKRVVLLRVGFVLLVLIGLAVALLQWAVSGIDDWKGLALNLGTEMIGAAVTYVLFELVIERMERREAEREAEKKELKEKLEDLIRRMGSTVRDVAVEAAEEAKWNGWLYSGALRGVSLANANLQGADLSGARLERVSLEGADLQGAILGAHLQEANLSGANLQGAWLVMANLEGAYCDYSTILPDGTRWALDTDMARFTDPGHPDFWFPDA